MTWGVRSPAMAVGEGSSAATGTTAADDAVVATAAQLDALRRRVLNVVGHELRTPVTTMRGLAEALSADPPDDARHELVDALVRCARRTEHLLDDLLLATGVETALPVGDRVAVPVAAAVTALAADHGLAVVIVEGAETVEALLRPDTLRRITAPVMDNAAKYGGGPGEVRVEADGAAVVVTVWSPADVAPEDLALAFEPFWRGEVAVMTTAGLGVGLPLARALVQDVGGRLTLAPGPSGGVVATIVLPSAASGE